jgi:predicted phosphodiesterase
MRIGNYRHKILIALLILIGITKNGTAQNIVIYGDSRTNHDIHKKIVAAILKEKPIMVFHTGDLVFNGKMKSQWDNFHSIISPLLKIAKFYPCYGNHELKSKLMADYYKLPNKGRWYSVDTLGIHFVVLDNYAKYGKKSKQYKWLNEDLKNNNSKFTIVVMHKPPFTTTKHAAGSKKPRKKLVPLFEDHKVDVVFSGHVHAYEKSVSNNVLYITTGGGGAPLHSQISSSQYCKLFVKNYNFCKIWTENNTLNIQAMDTASNIIDKIQITK